jgi:hypothetical protein
MAWAAPQDWMCEPFILEKTGRTLEYHLRQTVGNYFLLKQLAPDLPFIPVVQGWDIGDYHRCVDLYAERGLDLATEQIVGLGSVCRRQGTDVNLAADICDELHSRGISLHAFGFKTTGLAMCSRYLASADSMAWSFRARRDKPMAECLHSSCANCLKYAVNWTMRKIYPAIYRGQTSIRQKRLF